MLMTMQGTPYIYQGEEIGMTNVSFDSIEDYDDVEIHNCWKERVIKGGEDPEKLLDGIRYRARDNARTPMQWSDEENGGFTTGTPLAESKSQLQRDQCKRSAGRRGFYLSLHAETDPYEKRKSYCGIRGF